MALSEFEHKNGRENVNEMYSVLNANENENILLETRVTI